MKFWGRWKREREDCVHKLQVGFFSFGLSFNSSSIYYWPFTTDRLCARHWGHSDDQAPFPALVEFKVWEDGAVDTPRQCIWALVEAGLEEEDANLAGKDVEGFLEREDGGVGVHPKGWRRDCGRTVRRRFPGRGNERNPLGERDTRRRFLSRGGPRWRAFVGNLVLI